jgi:hypothetical protein
MYVYTGISETTVPGIMVILTQTRVIIDVFRCSDRTVVLEYPGILPTWLRFDFVLDSLGNPGLSRTFCNLLLLFEELEVQDGSCNRMG